MFLHITSQPEMRAAPCPRGGRRQNRARIVDAAGRLLRRRSLDAIGMDDIARETGLTRRTIYNYFGNTGEIFAVSRKALFAEIAPLVPVTVTDKAPTAAALTRFAFQALRLFGDRRHADLYLSVAREGEAHPWIVQSYDARIQAPMVAAIAAWLGEVRRARGFDGDPQVAAFQLLWTLQAAAASRLFGHDGERDDGARVMVEAIVNAFLVQHCAETAPGTAIAA